MEYTDLEELLVVRVAYSGPSCVGTVFYEVSWHFVVLNHFLDISLSDSEDHRSSINLVLGLDFVNVVGK